MAAGRPTLAAVRRAVARVGGAELFVEDAGQCGVLASVWTPAGLAWGANGSHCLSGYSATDRMSVWEELLDRMGRYGTEPCTVEECDTCDPEE